VAIVSILPTENMSNSELEADLKKRLASNSFSVERIAIIDDQADLSELTDVDDSYQNKEKHVEEIVTRR